MFRPFAQKKSKNYGDDNDAMWRAVFSGNNKKVEQLLERGYPIDGKHLTSCGWELLHIAAANGKTAVAKLLINRDAKIDVLDNIGWTPFMYALDRKHFQTAAFLFENGASLNVFGQNNNNLVLKLLNDPKNAKFFNYLSWINKKPFFYSYYCAIHDVKIKPKDIEPVIVEEPIEIMEEQTEGKVQLEISPEESNNTLNHEDDSGSNENSPVIRISSKPNKIEEEININKFEADPIKEEEVSEPTTEIKNEKIEIEEENEPEAEINNDVNIENINPLNEGDNLVENPEENRTEQEKSETSQMEANDKEEEPENITVEDSPIIKAKEINSPTELELPKITETSVNNSPAEYIISLKALKSISSLYKNISEYL